KNVEELKTLFTGTGNELESKVEFVFKNLGFEIHDTVSNRDDLIVKYKDRIAVIEVKGVVGSAAEKNATQLEKWVTEYHFENEIEPKGILIVNAFKDIELKDRKDPTFPNQMLSYSIKKEHCLISSTQLLCLYFDAIKNPDKKEELINSLFDT